MGPPRRNDLLIPLLYVSGDVVAIVAAFAAAFAVRFSEPISALIEVTKGLPPLEAYIIGALVVAPFWLLMFNTRHAYRARRQTDFSTEFFLVLRVASIGMLVVMSLAFLYREFSYSRVVFAFIWVFAIAFVFTLRTLVLAYEKRLYRQGRELRNVLLAGANALAQHMAVHIAYAPALGYRLTGYVSDGDERIESHDTPRLGSYAEVAEIVRTHKIETIIVCIGAGEHGTVQALLGALEGLSVQILLQPEIIGITPTRLRVQELLGIPFLGVKDIPMTTWGRIAKRSFDLVLSSLALVLFAPAGLLIAVAILLESGRPVFYSQVRVGLDGRRFNLLKFRTMRVDAERETGPTWTRKGDARVTRMGRILRRLSIDEVPQLLNILKGEMSIVGPRPERPEFVEQFLDYVPRYGDRHRLKTGLTGWAQVNGLRGEVPIVERTKYDLYYIENWSLHLDIRIIFKTIRAILFGKDAY